MPSTTLQRYRAMPMRALRSSGSRPCCLESGRMAETPVTRHGRHAKLRAVLWAESRAAGVLSRFGQFGTGFLADFDVDKTLACARSNADLQAQ